MASEITGASGELIARFVELLGSPSKHTLTFAHDLGSFVLMWLGGPKIEIDTGREYASDTVGARRRADPNLRWVTPGQYLEAMRQRMADVAALGLDEAFIVKALRDALDEWMEGTVYTGEINEHRRHAREWAASEEGQALRRRLGAPETPDPLFADVTPEEAAVRQAAYAQWIERRDELLPEPIFDKWRFARLRPLPDM